MRTIFDKLLVIITCAIAVLVSFVVICVNVVCPKKIDTKKSLFWGNRNAGIQIVLFEDFTCEHCKEYTLRDFPKIKEGYIDTNKIGYSIIPLSFISGSKNIAHIAIAIYEMNKDQFFEFLQIISQKDFDMESKKELIEITKNLKGINSKLLAEFLVEEVYIDYLKDNFKIAKRVMLKNLQVPSMYLNGEKIPVEQISKKIEEYSKYSKEK